MKKYKYLSLIPIIILGIVLISGAHKALALTCAPATLQEQIDSATIIFAGKVTNIQIATSEKAASASFDVTEYWKGQVGNKITIGGIYAWTGARNPPSYFKIGETYLVFARSVPNADSAKNIPNNLIARINCGRTTLLTSATQEKIALGQGKIPTDGSSHTLY